MSQRCMYLYSQILYANADLELNNLEDTRYFETLYLFLSKVVHSCIQQTLEGMPRGTASLSCQALVEEEVGRLFRSPVFNASRAEKAKEKERKKAEIHGTESTPQPQ